MQRNNGNGHNSLGQPLPVSVIELFDSTLAMRVRDKTAEVIHDGSKPFWPFNTDIETKSKKYKKAYLVKVEDYKVRISLVFDYRDDPVSHKPYNIGYVNVTEKGRELLAKGKILEI